jgi:hypothetical protein
VPFVPFVLNRSVPFRALPDVRESRALVLRFVPVETPVALLASNLFMDSVTWKCADAEASPHHTSVRVDQ